MATTRKKTVTPQPGSATVNADGLNFAALVSAIQRIHEESAAAVKRVVNTALTLRNWMIGAYLHHYELHGQDRAKYGDAMIDRLDAELARCQVSACERQRLYSYLAFFVPIRKWSALYLAVPCLRCSCRWHEYRMKAKLSGQ